jgi:hypothetical protein
VTGTTVDLVRYQDLLWALPVAVGGEEALFLLDTAAGLTTLDRALAGRIGVAMSGRHTGVRMTGESVTLDLASDVELRLGDAAVSHETVGVFDLSAMLPPDWPPVGGAIGLPTFARRTVTLDFADARLLFDATPGPKAGEIRVRPRRDGPSLDLFVEVRAPARALWLELDTANTGPVILSPEAVAALGFGTTPEEATLDVTGLGPVRTAVVEKPIRHDGNLGAPFLAGRRLTLDLAAGRAWIDSP